VVLHGHRGHRGVRDGRRCAHLRLVPLASQTLSPSVQRSIAAEELEIVDDDVRMGKEEVLGLEVLPARVRVDSSRKK